MSAAAIQPRSSATLLGLLLLAVLAAAGYYTYRRATPALTPSVATEQASGTVVPAVIGPGNSGSGVITLAAPAATAAQTPANSAATAPVIDASAANPAPAQRDAVSVQPPADAGIAPRTPRIRVPRASSVAADPAVKPAPCTEAVAALGLCKL